MSLELDALVAAFRAKGSVVTAFSGGVDSALLARIGQLALPAGKALALIVDSESYAREERDAAESFARDLGLAYEVAWHSELADANYAANPTNRCYFCRKGLSDVAFDFARERGFAAVAVGTNASDLGEWRPGLKALAEANAWQPFLELGIDKAGVRALARELGLSVAEKPSMACLSSRIPYGEAITVGKLQRVGRAESWLRERGFRQVRVRSLGDLARIEVLPEEIARLRQLEETLTPALVAMGYARVEIDPRGYRSGALNEGLLVRPR
ncbi:MAG: ATP-dependent sacrificial sulfur transferase LarE [Thermoplasmatota archaeon]